MIKEGQYAPAIRSFLLLSPEGALGPWQSMQVADFYIAVQAHLPPGIQWFALEQLLRIPAAQIKTKSDVAKYIHEQGVQSYFIRLHVRAYEDLRRIFAAANGFEYVPLPAGRSAMPTAKEVSLNGQYIITQIKPFYETCMCIDCVSNRLELERQARIRNGDEDDDDEDHHADF